MWKSIRKHKTKKVFNWKGIKVRKNKSMKLQGDKNIRL